MPLKSLGPLVDLVPTNLAAVANVQPMQLVQPIGNRLPVPVQGQILRIVRDIGVLLLHLVHFFHILFLLLFTGGPRLFALNVLLGSRPFGADQLGKSESIT